MNLRRRTTAAIAFALLGLAIAALPVVDENNAEALTRGRAKIAWGSVQRLPRGLADREEYLSRYPLDRGGPLVFLRDGTLSRQSQNDVLRAQITPVPGGPTSPLVLAGREFADLVTFVPSVDMNDAVLYINQPPYGSSLAPDCHVRVASVTDVNAQPVGTPIAGVATEVFLGRLPAASAPYTVDLRSKVPGSSQARAPTARVFTSVIRLGERIPDRSTPRAGASPTPRPERRVCGGEIGGRGANSLVRPLVLRTEMNLNQWAQMNGRNTPTPVAIR